MIRMNRFWMFCTKKFYVNRVSVRHGVRSYSLISLRKFTPLRIMFLVHYSSLYKCITLDAIMLVLSIVVSFSPCKTQGGFPQTFLQPMMTQKLAQADHRQANEKPWEEKWQPVAARKVKVSWRSRLTGAHPLSSFTLTGGFSPSGMLCWSRI